MIKLTMGFFGVHNIFRQTQNAWLWVEIATVMAPAMLSIPQLSYQSAPRGLVRSAAGCLEVQDGLFWGLKPTRDSVYAALPPVVDTQHHSATIRWGFVRIQDIPCIPCIPYGWFRLIIIFHHFHLAIQDAPRWMVDFPAMEPMTPDDTRGYLINYLSYC